MYQRVLQKFGLKNPEIDVYTLLLQLGAQPASIIAKKLQLKRTTTRTYLENLTKLGLIRFQLKDRTQYFFAEKPQAALDMLKNQKERAIHRLEENINAFGSIIPELNSLIQTDSLIPKITSYEGLDELKRMYQDTLTAETEILCLSSVDDLIELFGAEYDNWYVKKRAQKNIPLRYITKDTPQERQERQKDSELLRQSRLLPPHSFSISNEINIYDNKVSIITLKEEKIGVLIESQEIARTMRIIFEVLWGIGT